MKKFVLGILTLCLILVGGSYVENITINSNLPIVACDVI